jgi:hypothetical protein
MTVGTVLLEAQRVCSDGACSRCRLQSALVIADRATISVLTCNHLDRDRLRQLTTSTHATAPRVWLEWSRPSS